MPILVLASARNGINGQVPNAYLPLLVDILGSISTKERH
jgi:hypothetical protein